MAGFVCLVVTLFCSEYSARAGKIVHQANWTVCYICDDADFSGRNFMCCLVHSRCCGPESLDRRKRTLL